MNSIPIIILPGMDGTDLLLERFMQLSPAPDETSIIAIPDDVRDDYHSLAEKFSKRVGVYQSCHIIAESFSGPLGILLAHRFPGIVRRLTLVATFATSPLPVMAAAIPWSLVFRLPIPGFLANRFLAGGHDWTLGRLNDAIGRTSPACLAKRMRCIMRVDVAGELSELKCKIDYIRPKHDRLVRKRSMKKIVAANPSVSAIEIDGPHLILQTRPEEVWLKIASTR